MKKIILPVFILAFLFLNITVSGWLIASGWWNTSYGFRYPILSNATTANLPISINGTYGIGGSIISAQNCTEQCYAYCTISGCATGLVAIANETDEKYWANDSNIYGGNEEVKVFEPENMTLRYGFGNRSGNTVYDFSASRNNATTSGNPIWNSLGVFDYGMTFDGNGDILTLGTEFGTTNNFTITFWMRHNDSATENRYYVTSSTAISSLYSYLFLGWNAVKSGCANKLSCGGIELRHGSLTIVYHFNFSRNTNWNQYTIVKDEKNLSFWQNGTYLGSNTTDTIGESIEIKYLMRDKTDTYNTNGSLDEFKVYNRSLSKAEIQELYWNGINNLTSLRAREFNLNIAIDYPTNTTYYNIYSLDLNVINGTDIDTWWYSLNGASNISFTPNTTFIPFLGSQNITVWANETEEYPFDADMVAWYHLNNDSDYGENNTHVYDFSGFGNNGTVSSATWTSSGKFGDGAFEFDGTNDYINISPDSSLNFGTGDFSVGAWIKTNVTEIMYIFVKENDSEVGFALWIWNDGRAAFGAWNSTVDTNYAYSTSTVLDDEWHHVVGVRNSSHVSIYVDSILEDSNASSGINVSVIDYEAIIGYSRVNDDYYFNGTIDEVAIYNRSLIAAEVLDLYEVNWFSDTVWFTLDFICTGSYVSANTSHKCMGASMNYLAPCRRFGYDTFQWDTTNMSLCQYGCRNGVCLNATYVTCYDRCNVNETVCTADARYSVPCKNHTQTGCYDWDYENRTYCDHGCYDGQCMTKISFCTAGESKCNGEKEFVVFCDDDNNDGYYEWSEFNRTHCEYRCQQDYNTTTNLWNASCHYHSYTTPELIFSRFEWLTSMGSAVFVSPLLRMGIILIISIIAAIIASLIGSWRMGIPAFFGMMLLGTIGGWMPWYITFIMIVLGGIIVFKIGET